MLSEIERGAKSPTIALLAAIAEGLRVPLSGLVSGGPPVSVAGQVIRAGEQRFIEDETGVRRINLGAPHEGSTVEFVRFSLPPGAASGTFAAHRAGTFERIHVERGKLEVRFGEQHVTLREGDTLTYEAEVRHGFVNIGAKPAVVYLVIERR